MTDLKVAKLYEPSADILNIVRSFLEYVERGDIRAFQIVGIGPDANMQWRSTGCQADELALIGALAVGMNHAIKSYTKGSQSEQLLS